MKKTYVILLLCIGALYFADAQPHAKAQGQVTCAGSRIQTATRQAVATPQHMQLMNMYDVTFYGLDLALERNSVFIAGSVTTHAQVKSKPLSVFAFELHSNFTLESVTINGVAQTNITRNAGDVSVNLNAPVAANGTIKAVIKYSGSAPQSGNAAIGNGFSTAREQRWGNDITWSLSEPYAAYEWWPTKQVLTDKADSVHVFVTTSPENKAGSNGLLTKTETLPSGKVRYSWMSRYPIDYYLISVAVSNYEEYVQFANPIGAARPIPIVNYVYKGGALAAFKEEIDRTAPFIEYFSQVFTLYPFAREKYGHSMAPMGGGMEHQTMTTQSTFVFTLTAHELAHQWFGDNVTCASWQDIWLNEGFASYAEYLALQKFMSADAGRGWMDDAHNRVMQTLNGSVKVPDTTNVGRIFNYNLTYKKGAAVVHMLRYEINNDELFFTALRNYQTQYQGKTATTADLQRVVEQTTRKDFDYFFKQWYEGEGWPTFTLNWEQQNGHLTLNTTQTTSATTPFFKTDITYLLQTTTGDTLVRVPHTKPTEQYRIRTRRVVTGVLIDPAGWLLARKIVQNVTASPELPEELAPQVYPNPTTGRLTLENLTFQPATIEVHDRTGRLVLHQQLQRHQQPQLSVATLPAGLYFIRATNGSKTFRSKFVKL